MNIISLSNGEKNSYKFNDDKILKEARGLNLLLEILIEEVERQWEYARVLLEEVLEIVDVSDECAKSSCLALDYFFFQVVGDTGVVALSLVLVQSGVRMVTVDVISADQKFLLDFDSLCESLDFVEISMKQDCSIIGIFERVFNAALCGFLDHLEPLIPGPISQSVQDLFESRTILQVSSELSGQEQVLVGADNVIIGELDKVIVLLATVEDQR